MEAGVWRDAVRSGPKVQGAGEREREAQEAGGGSDSGQCHTLGGSHGVSIIPKGNTEWGMKHQMESFILSMLHKVRKRSLFVVVVGG